MIILEDPNTGIIRINEELISDVESLLSVLDHDKTDTVTKAEINLTIQQYAAKIRENI